MPTGIFTLKQNLQSIKEKTWTTPSNQPLTSTYAASFNSSSQYLSANSSGFAFGTGDFTIEAWVNSSDVSGSTQKAYLQTSDTAGGLKSSYTTGVMIFFGVGTGGNLDGAIEANVGANNIVGPLPAVTAGTWNHIAVTRASGAVKIFVNGNMTANGTATDNCTGTNLSIGGGYSTNFLLNGFMSNVRIVKGTALYTSNFISPSAPLTAIANTSILTLQNQTIVDNSVNNLSITNNGSVNNSIAYVFSNQNLYPPKEVEYLLVGGGGGGGVYWGGGGGGGGLLQGSMPTTDRTSYTVTVGAGGTSSNTSFVNGGFGGNSTLGNIVATGGAGGLAYASAYDYRTPGGSGGGGSLYVIGGGTPGTPGQGNPGGAGNNPNQGGGGGGGAGTKGFDSGVGGDYGGSGGAGIASTITGVPILYSGGGGGGGPSKQGLGGAGGGGPGAYTGIAASGSTNTGGGGGGENTQPLAGQRSGVGGSGIVVVRYPGNVQYFTGGTVNYINNYITHIFTSSGVLAPITPTVYNTSYQISRSLRFNKSGSSYLNRTPASAGNRKTWTYSGWVKLTGIPTTTADPVPIFGAMSAANDSGYFTLGFLNEVISIQLWNTVFRRTTAVYRDYSAWQHIVIAFDTTQATAANRLKLYVNGVEVTAFSTSNDPTQNTDYPINNNIVHNMFKDQASSYIGGYLSEVNFVDGLQLTPSSFGAIDTATGVWKPIKYTGTYGTNGFYLNFSDNSGTTAATLGKDSSGNDNNWTPNNFSVTAGVTNDSFVDSPTSYGTDTGAGGEVRGNYCIWNRLDTTSTSYLYNGNLSNSSAANNYPIRGTIGFSSGKWYWEWTEAATPDNHIGVWGSSSLTAGTYNYVGEAADSWGIHTSDGNKRNNGGNTSYGSAYANGDVGMCAVDMDSGKIWWGKNGTWFASGSPSAGTNAAFTNLTGILRPAQIQYSAASFNFGQRPFAYTAPSGFKALCTQNLLTPAIGSTSITQASQFFNTVLYTGNDGTQSITGVGFQPDFIWTKSRSNAFYHVLFDSIRGREMLATNRTDAEVSSTAGKELLTYDSNGFTLGPNISLSVNTNGATFTAWNWRAGNNSGANNSAGSISSRISVNERSGFSIVSYTATGSVATIGHGLNVAPSMIILKTRSTTSDWFTYHSARGATKGFYLNQTSAEITSANFWNNTSPTSSVFTAGTGVGGSGTTMIAYCFAQVDGFSAFGSYTGNGAADGPFVNCGFRPAFLMIKSSASTTDWFMFDNKRNGYNVNNNSLYANWTYVEDSGAIYTLVDLLSNGFKLRTSTYNNTNGTSYIFAAFAETPFKYSLAR